MEHAFKSPADWLVDYLSERLAKYSGRPSNEIAARIVDGRKSGDLPTEVWMVEHLDGTRLRQPGFTRIDFFFWWMCDGLFAIPHEDQDQVWPREVFKDNRIADLERLTGRWKTHASGFPAPDLYEALCAALDELAVLRWSQSDLAIGRDDFVAWYKCSPLCSTQSAIADTILAVSADELWPPAVPGEGLAKSPVSSWRLLTRAEAIRRAAAEILPEGNQAGMHMKKVKKVLGDHIVAKGGQRPSDKTFQRELAKLKASRQAL